MVNRLIEAALHYRGLVLMLGIAFIVAGVNAMASLPIDAFPDVTNVQVQVVTGAPGMAPEEVENLATVPIESVMNGIPGVQKVRSTTMYGLSQVTVIFDDGIDVYFARQQVQERLNQLGGQLGANVETPTLGPVTVGIGTIFRYTVEGPPGYDQTELHTLQQFVVARELKTVPGVADVITFGGLIREFQVRIDPNRLAQYGMAVDDVYKAVAASNSNVGAGRVDRGAESWLVRGIGVLHSVDDIADIVIVARGSTPIRVGDVATVTIGPAPQVGTITKNGDPTELTSGVVLQRKGESTRTVMARVQAKLAEIRRALPPGVRIVTYYDQTELVGKTIHTVAKALLEGGVLVILVLILFLGNLRAALLVAFTIPLSLLFAFIMMERFGFSANLLTLGAVDFGMIVDGSVVMVENVFCKLAHPGAEPRSTTDVVLDAAHEVGRPILFAITIIIIVYLPLMTLQGIEGKFFAPMAFTVSFALLGSLLCALTLVPVLCTFVLRGRIRERQSGVFLAVRAAYLRSLDRLTARRRAAVLVAFALLATSIAAIPLLGSEFLPNLDEGSILLRSVKLPSISLAASRGFAMRIERACRDFPEVTGVISRTGRAEGGFDPEGFQITHTEMSLAPRDKWRFKTKEELVDALAKHVDENVPGAAFTFTQPIADMIDDLMAGARAEVAVKIHGEDLQTLGAIGKRAQRVLSTVPGVSDLSTEQLVGLPQTQIRIKPDAAARYGIRVEDMQDVIRIAIGGKVATQVIDGAKRFDVAVRYLPKARSDKEDFSKIEVRAPDGARVPLGELADIRDVQGTAEISREDGQRSITVSCNVRGRDLGGFVAEAKRKINSEIHLPPDYFIAWGGQAENQARATRRLEIVVPVVILLIFFLLNTTFRSGWNAAVIILNIPFAMIGGIVALFIASLHLSVAAIIGFIALFGLSVQNGLIMVTRFNALRAEGLPLAEAVKRGAEDRFRPVMMTALVASLGFVPMVFSTGVGAEIPKPLATVVVGGLVSCTILTLFLVPIVYGWVEEKRFQR